MYIDVDRDGVFSSADKGVANLVVAIGPSRYGVTDARGRYRVRAPDGEQLVWVRTSDAFAPGGNWERAPARGDADLDIEVVPTAQSGPLRFVVASDTHAGYSTLSPEALASAIEQIGAAEPDASFLVITGDLTQSDEPEEYAILAAALGAVHSPFVPVPGNHDWADGGETYRAVFGPPSYAFDAGGAHFVVLNDASSVQQRGAFLQWDRSLMEDDRLTVAFMHAPPRPELIAVLEAAGVDYVFTGHLHANRVLLHDTIVELNTQPLALGGIDLTPSGFRVVSLTDGDTLRIEHVWIYEGALDSPPDPSQPTSPLSPADWPQLQGGPLHRGATAASIQPPIVERWRRDLGTTLMRGSPVVSDGVVFVSLVDLDDGLDGGVAALDGARGSELWRYVTGVSVRGAPAVEGGTVVISAADGTVHALDIATGAPRWIYSLAEVAEPRLRGLYAAPTIVDGVVYTGLSRELVAIDLASGAPLWSQPLSTGNTWYGTHAAPAVAGDLLVAAVGNGGDGLRAWDARSGALVWQTSPSVSVGMTASPIIVGETVFAINEQTSMTAVDLFTGATVWRRKLHVDGFNNGRGAVATPAYSGDALFVPTQHGALLAIDALSGVERWRIEADDALLRCATNRARVAAFASAPAVAGDLVWFGGADGRLIAADVQTGEIAFSTQLGAPILSGIAPAPPTLFVSTVDGVLHAFGPAPEPPAGSGGCRIGRRGLGAGAGQAGLVVLVLWVAAILGTRRRTRGILGS